MLRVLSLTLLLALLPCVAAEEPKLPREFETIAAAVRPTEAELMWRKIGWGTDLAAAMKTAKTEKRPVLVWVAGDDPLGRC